MTWRDITPPDFERSDDKWDAGERAFFLDRGAGWMLATRAHDFDTPSDIFIWRTVNGGDTWEKTRLDGPAMDPDTAPPYFHPQTLQFVDAQTGWFVTQGAGGNMGGVSYYATHDGGGSWQRIGRQGGLNGSYGLVHFTSQLNGWQTWSRTPDESMTITNDGGITWTSVSLPKGANEFGDRSWLGGYGYGDLDENAGVIPARQNAGKTNLYITRDAGRTWNLAGTAQSTEGKFFFLSSDAWFLGTQMHFFRTLNGGATWEAFEVDWPKATRCVLEPKQVEFADPDHGWVLLVNQEYSETVLAATTDGGQTWQEIEP